MIVDNPNILTLAEKLEQIPNVLQVRFWKPLKKAKAAGPGGMCFVCLTDDLENAGEFRHFQMVVPASVINDETLHQEIINGVTLRIEHYFQTKEFVLSNTDWGEKVPNSWLPEYPQEDDPSQNTENPSQNP